MPWVVKRAQQYVTWLHGRRLKGQTPEQLQQYFVRTGQSGRYEAFQYSQIVYALELLFRHMVPGCQWCFVAAGDWHPTHLVMSIQVIGAILQLMLLWQLAIVEPICTKLIRSFILVMDLSQWETA